MSIATPDEIAEWVGGYYRIVIPDYRPALVNELMSHWAKSARLKRQDREIIAGYCQRLGVPKARGKRRVSLHVTVPDLRKRFDPDAPWKSLLDALVKGGYLRGDTAADVELGTVTLTKGPRLESVITLEEVE